MIARHWHGAVLAEKADAYMRYLEKTGIPDSKATPGNRGVYVLTRREGKLAHFVFVSLWESRDAIRAFAGDDLEKARYYPEDADYLLELEPDGDPLRGRGRSVVPPLRTSCSPPGKGIRLPDVSSVLQRREVADDSGQEGHGGVPRHVLAGSRGLRQRGAGRGVSQRRDRTPGGFAGVRPDRGHDGLRDRPRLGVPPQPGGHRGARRGKAVPRERARPVRHRPGAGRRGGRRRALPDRQRQGGLRPLRGIRVQRLRRALARGLLPGRRFRLRDRHDVRVPGRDPRRDGPARAGGAGRARDRSVSHAHPPDQHSGDQHVREPGALHGPGPVRRRLGAFAAVAVLGGADRGSGASRARSTGASSRKTRASPRCARPSRRRRSARSSRGSWRRRAASRRACR